MKNTAKHQVDLFRLLALYIEMIYGQEVGLEEILIGHVHIMEFILAFR